METFLTAQLGKILGGAGGIITVFIVVLYLLKARLTRLEEDVSSHINKTMETFKTYTPTTELDLKFEKMIDSQKLILKNLSDKLERIQEDIREIKQRN